MGIVNSLRFILGHPLNEGQGLTTLVRFVAWQVGSRLVPGPIQVPFVGNSRLVVEPGMTGATGNVYTGLHEFEDMGFLLHFLRPEDLFVDVGANVGSYTVLSSGVVGARTLAFEPLPAAFESLVANVDVNGISERVDACNVALGSAQGELAFTTHLDTQNRALRPGEASGGGMTQARVRTLDEALGERRPALIKLDVEGYEPEVLAGAAETLKQPSLQALILELNGAGNRYGFDEAVTHREMLAQGFATYRYDPFKRELVTLEGADTLGSGNALYLRDVDAVRTRLAAAPRFRVRGREL